MASITAKITGGSSRDLNASTVGDVKRQLGVPSYQASVNGSPASDAASLNEDDFITLSPPVKGGSH